VKGISFHFQGRTLNRPAATLKADGIGVGPYLMRFEGASLERIDEGRNVGAAAGGVVVGALLLGPLGALAGAAVGGRKRHTLMLRAGDACLVFEATTIELQILAGKGLLTPSYQPAPGHQPRPQIGYPPPPGYTAQLAGLVEARPVASRATDSGLWAVLAIGGGLILIILVIGIVVAWQTTHAPPVPVIGGPRLTATTPPEVRIEDLPKAAPTATRRSPAAAAKPTATAHSHDGGDCGCAGDLVCEMKCAGVQ
jgi:hypothetical protein